MRRYDFYFGQKVRHTEIDDAFDAVEDAIAEFLQGFGLSGIINGADVTEHNPTPNFTVDVSGPALVYDQLSQKIAWSATENIDCTVDENGAATAVTTSGNEKYLSIFAEYERSLSDPRTDRNGATVFFVRAESYKINVVQGVEAPTGTAVKPALRADQVLLGDVLITYGMTQIQNSDIDLNRAEYPYDFTGSPTTIREKGLTDVLQTMLDNINVINTGAALLAASNVFTNTNEFQADVTISGSADLTVGGDIIANRIEQNGEFTSKNQITFDESTTPLMVNPRIVVDYDFPTSGPTKKVQILTGSENASGNRNPRLYSYNGGFEFVIGAEWNGTTWYYESGVSSASRLRVSYNSIVLESHSGADGWADGSWDNTEFSVGTSGLTIESTSRLKFSSALTIVKNIGPAQMTPFDGTSWNLRQRGVNTPYWRSEADTEYLFIPISFPIDGNSYTTTVEAMVKPGAARAYSDRMILKILGSVPNWSTPAQPTFDEQAEDYDDGTTDIQVLSVNESISREEGRYMVACIRSGSDGGTNKDLVYAVRVTTSVLEQSPHWGSV